MSGNYGDQLEALQDLAEEGYRLAEQNFRQAEQNFRQAEENFRLDMSAIEHLHRRFFGTVSSIPTSNYSPASNGSNSESPTSNYSPASNGSNSESPTTILPLQSTPAGPQSDELVGSLRSMLKVDPVQFKADTLQSMFKVGLHLDSH